MTPKNGDGVILFNGERGICISDAFMTNTDIPYPVVAVEFDDWSGPIQLEAITEIWRDGLRIDNVKQLTLWGSL